nr:MAG TPA: hypothetical protein [Caudoviricetes sp.]DAZ16833.1 MAG TPA: hypothetical protein [Caudoviricetes sp.]
MIVGIHLNLIKKIQLESVIVTGSFFCAKI